MFERMISEIRTTYPEHLWDVRSESALDTYLKSEKSNLFIPEEMEYACKELLIEKGIQMKASEFFKGGFLQATLLNRDGWRSETATQTILRVDPNFFTSDIYKDFLKNRGKAA